MRRVTALLCMLVGAIAQIAPLHAQQLPAPIVASLQADTDRTAVGTQRPDVVIVEYLDYNCPYCKKSAPQLQKLLKSDPGVRVIFKEWPIFGDASVYAARSALAASWQGRFGAAHDALINTARDLESAADVDAVLRTVAGLDPTQLHSDRQRHAGEIDALLARTERETHALGVPGTPVFVIGRQLINSGLNFAQLQQAVAQARAEGPATRR
jgi:protein-disulfide isomerase